MLYSINQQFYIHFHQLRQLLFVYVQYYHSTDSVLYHLGNSTCDSRYVDKSALLGPTSSVGPICV